ncbi:MAG: RNA 2',3'-cyclic phosphodiesterase [Anaerolineales bacterium]
MRAFLASRLPDALRAKLALQIDMLTEFVPPETVRWVRPENIHLTLKFLGEISSDEAQLVVDSAGPIAAGCRPFDLSASGLGVFPNPKRPRVIWVGVSGAEEGVTALNRELESALAGVGFDREGRGFHPHLTLGRTRRGLRRLDLKALAEALARASVGDLGQWRVETLALMRSELRPEGPRYSVVASLPLGTAVD